VDDFCKDLHIVRMGAAGFAAVGDATETLAAAEGLDAHAQSIRLRREAAGA
jgi:histidinol dehydrogenase